MTDETCMDRIKLLLILNIFVTCGCATGNFDPNQGECEKSLYGEFTTIYSSNVDVAIAECRSAKYKKDDEIEYNRRIKTDPEFAKSELEKAEMLKRQELENARREEEERSNQEEAQRQAIKQEQLLLRNQKRVMQVGSDINDFQRYFGRANTEEIVNGDTVLWYDNSEKPIFVIFHKSKLKSFIIDRETIRHRQITQSQNRQRADSERQHQQNLDEARAIREQAYWNNLVNSINSSRPVNTNCTRDMYGNLNCTSY